MTKHKSAYKNFILLKLLSFGAIFTISLLLGGMRADFVHAEPVPSGCGRTGPASACVDKNGKPIPFGCPGSIQVGPYSNETIKANLTHCPYWSSSLPDCSGSQVICNQLPAGCPGSPFQGSTSGVQCPYGVDPNTGQVVTTTGKDGPVKLGTSNAKYTCGGGKDAVPVSVNIGCSGKGNALVDATFAIIRFLSIGVGVIVVASLVWAGIQYSSSRGDPNATARAKERIQNTLLALLVYIFAFAILNFVIPKGFFKL